jgi:hypothetical protein
MKDHNKKTHKRAERIAERWRRALACHGREVARAEIEYDLVLIKSAINLNDVCFPELSIDEHSLLYPILLKMKDSVFQKRAGKNKQTMSFRLTEACRFKLEHLAETGGVSMTSVIENLLIQAESFKIAVPTQVGER